MTDNAKPIASPFSFAPYKEVEGEEYMNEAQLKHFETILNNWKAELMHEVDRTVHHMQDDAAHFCITSHVIDQVPKIHIHHGTQAHEIPKSNPLS